MIDQLAEIGAFDDRRDFSELWDISDTFASNSGIDLGTWSGIDFDSPVGPQ
jgi:hypothetical protein